jgi:hypothetical protein
VRFDHKKKAAQPDEEQKPDFVVHVQNAASQRGRNSSSSSKM